MDNRCEYVIENEGHKIIYLHNVGDIKNQKKQKKKFLGFYVKRERCNLLLNTTVQFKYLAIHKEN